MKEWAKRTKQKKIKNDDEDNETEKMEKKWRISKKNHVVNFFFFFES